MARVKVKLADNIARVVFIETGATIGATIGTDLKLPSGAVATVDSLRTLLGVGDTTNAETENHRLLQGLALGDDHPQYTRKDTLTDRGDLYFRNDTTVARLAKGADRTFLRAGESDPAWETVSPVITLGTDLSGNVTLTNLANGTLNATIADQAVTNTKLRDSNGLSVIGRFTSTPGTPDDIIAAADGGVLRRSGTAIAFGNIKTSSTDFTVGARVMGNSGAGGAAEELTLSQILDFIGSPTVGDVLYRGSSTWQRLAIGVADTVLTSHGAGAAPSWDVVPVSSSVGDLVYADGSVPTANTVANTTAETAFDSQYVIDSADLIPGTAFRVKLFGTYGTDSVAPTLRIKAKLGGTTIADTTAFTCSGSVADLGWQCELVIIVTSSGSSGTVEAQAVLSFSTSASDGQVVHAANTAPVVVNMSADCAITVTANWGTANANNAIKLRQMLVNLQRFDATAVSSLVALLHLNGTNGSTTITDVVGSITWTPSGNAQLDTAVNKFGTASLILDGAGDWVEGSDALLAPGTGDFTIEGFVRFETSLSGNKFFWTFGSGFGVYTFSGQWAVFDGSASNLITGGSVTTNTWYHVALCRSGTSLRLFVDGTQVGGTATNSTNLSNTTLRIGAHPTGSEMIGHVDEFRVTREALYTANFTAPSAEFPDP